MSLEKWGGHLRALCQVCVGYVLAKKVDGEVWEVCVRYVLASGEIWKMGRPSDKMGGMCQVCVVCVVCVF